MLVWVGSAGDCPPMNRLLVLRDNAFIDLPRPSTDRLWTAVW